MSNGKSNQQYRHNHYVPEWYQRRFMLRGQNKYWYLDLKPERRTSGGMTYTRRDLLYWGPDRCFAQDDLYTTQWSGIVSTEIEQFFFGDLDSEGKKATEYFGCFKHPSVDGDMLETFIPYMSAQKLRTPKGLATLQAMARLRNRNLTLMLLQRMRNIYCAIWTECVWQICGQRRDHLLPRTALQCGGERSDRDNENAEILPGCRADHRRAYQRRAQVDSLRPSR